MTADTRLQDPASPQCWQHTAQDASPKQQARPVPERTYIPTKGLHDPPPPWLQDISPMAPRSLSLAQVFLGLNLEIQQPPGYRQGSSTPHMTKTVSSIPH